MLGTFSKFGKSNIELQLFDYAKQNLEIGLDHLYIFDLANDFFEEMSNIYFEHSIQLFESSNISEHGAKEIAWAEITEVMKNRIYSYPPKNVSLL